jgi:hypothetical protein
MIYSVLSSHPAPVHNGQSEHLGSLLYAPEVDPLVRGVQVRPGGAVAGRRDAVVEVEEAGIGCSGEGEEAGLLARDLLVAPPQRLHDRLCAVHDAAPAKVAKAASVPVSGANCGKNSWLKTSAAAVPYKT